MLQKYVVKYFKTFFKCLRRRRSTNFHKIIKQIYSENITNIVGIKSLHKKRDRKDLLKNNKKIVKFSKAFY